MPQGTIKKLTDKGFGFIEGERGDIFFHHSALEETTYENLVMLCVECNRMKGSKTWDDFLKEYQKNGHHIFEFKKVS